MKSRNSWFGWFMVLMVLFLFVPAYGADAPAPDAANDLKAQVVQTAGDAAKAAVENAVEAAKPAAKEVIGVISNGKSQVVAVATTATAVVAEKAPGWGKEIGTMLKDAGVAFVDTANGTLNVTQDHLERFASSDAGKFAMFAIAWKLFAKDFLEVGEVLMGYIIGGLLLIILSKVIWTVNRRLTHGAMVVKSQTGWGIFSKKTKEFVPANMDNDEKTGVYVASLVAQIIVIIVSCIIMF